MNKIKINLNETGKIRRFTQVVREFLSDIDIMTDFRKIDAKSILGIYTLDLSRDTYVTIISDNAEEIRRFDSAMEEFR